MAKKTSGGKKKAKNAPSADDAFYNMLQFNPEVCKLKHMGIDKELKAISDRIDSLREDIKADVVNANENLKNKIILGEKIIGEKLDVLNDFDSELRGNGDPGVWESVRGLKWRVRIMMGLLVIIIILVLGGSYRGISLDGIKKVIGINSTQMEPEGGESHIYIPPARVVEPDETTSLVLPEKTDNNEFPFVIVSEPNEPPLP